MRKQVQSPEQTAADIAKVVELRKAGYSRDKIVAATGLKERFVREAMKGVEVEVKAKPASTSKLQTAASRAYPLAIRSQGCKDFELRQIAFEVYGSKYDEEKGAHTVAYTSSTLYDIRQRCKELAVGTNDSPVFVMDWVCDERPAASRVALESAALILEAKIAELVNDFMTEFATGQHPDQIDSTEAQRKQQYAARRHILKLAIREYSQESTASLLERSLSLTDGLDNEVDALLPVVAVKTSQEPREAVTEDVNNSLDPFFEDVMIAEEAVCIQADDVQEEEDPFATVGVATAHNIEKVKRAAQENERHYQYLAELMCDDVLGEVDEIVFDTKPECVYTPSFDITKFLGGKYATANRTGVTPSFNSEPF